MVPTHIASRRARVLTKLAVHGAIFIALFLWSHRAQAFVNVGAEAGVFKRSADAPNNLKLGFGYGLHGEITFFPLIKVGPYFVHYELSGDNPLGSDATFNTLGLRARLMLPIPGSIKPYGYVGAGYTWMSYGPPRFSDLNNPASARFIEIPIGLGLAYEPLPLLQISLDAAYRPGVSFGGNAFDLGVKTPDSGYSVMLGVAIDL
jgi:opacity protein-like surface antigen